MIRAVYWAVCAAALVAVVIFLVMYPHFLIVAPVLATIVAGMAGMMWFETSVLGWHENTPWGRRFAKFEQMLLVVVLSSLVASLSFEWYYS